MRTRILFSLLFSFAILLVILALGYTSLDIRDATGVVRDPDGHPIANAAVTLAGRSTLSDQAGHFALSIPRGTFQVIGFADGFAPASQTVSVDSIRDKAITLELTLPLNVFTGTVTATPAGRPIAGARVHPPVGADSTADEHGMFSLRGVKTGDPFQVSAPGYRAATFVYDPAGPHEFTLSPALTTIRVLDAYTQLPLPHTAVAAGAQNGQTDADGQVVLPALAVGTVVNARAAGHASGQATYNGEDRLTLTLVPNSLDGTILDAATVKPIPGALLLYPGQALAADDKGAYHLDKPSAELNLTVKAPGYRLTTVTITRTAQLDLALKPFTAKGIHIYYAEPREEVLALLDRLVGTEVNAIVLDVKEGPGDIVWPSKVPLALKINAYHARGIPPSELVEICRQRNWYCIARQVIFKDARLGAARTDLALHFPGRGVNAPGNEIWLNPAKKEVWDYNLALAKELSAMGFDEVQFDYIRYPGGATPPLEAGTADTRVATIKSFLAYISTAFKPLPTFFSGDVFGLTTAVHDEQGIGQLLEVDAPFLDYISPMMYPSTWKSAPNLFRGGLGNPKCAAALACPYDIIYRGTLQAQQRGKTLVRPWLQAYTDSGFGVPQYIAQKQGADAAKSSGWLFWNNQGIYPAAMFAKKAAGE